VIRVKGYASGTASNLVIHAVTPTEEGVFRVPPAADRRLFSIMAHMSWWADLGQYAGAYREGDDGSGPVLGLMRMTPSRWFNPTGMQIWSDPKAGLYVSAPLGITHRRSWEVDGVHDTEIGTEIHSGVFDPALPLEHGASRLGVLWPAPRLRWPPPTMRSPLPLPTA